MNASVANFSSNYSIQGLGNTTLATHNQAIAQQSIELQANNFCWFSGFLAYYNDAFLKLSANLFQAGSEIDPLRLWLDDYGHDNPDQTIFAAALRYIETKLKTLPSAPQSSGLFERLGRGGVRFDDERLGLLEAVDLPPKSRAVMMRLTQECLHWVLGYVSAYRHFQNKPAPPDNWQSINPFFHDYVAHNPVQCPYYLARAFIDKNGYFDEQHTKTDNALETAQHTQVSIEKPNLLITWINRFLYIALGIVSTGLYIIIDVGLNGHQQSLGKAVLISTKRYELMQGSFGWAREELAEYGYRYIDNPMFKRLVDEGLLPPMLPMQRKYFETKDR